MPPPPTAVFNPAANMMKWQAYLETLPHLSDTMNSDWFAVTHRRDARPYLSGQYTLGSVKMCNVAKVGTKQWAQVFGKAPPI